MACYVPGHLPHLHAGEQEKQLQAAAGMCSLLPGSLRWCWCCGPGQLRQTGGRQPDCGVRHVTKGGSQQTAELWQEDTDTFMSLREVCSQQTSATAAHRTPRSAERPPPSDTGPPPSTVPGRPRCE